MIMIMINMTLIKYRWMRTRRRKETFLRLPPTSRSFLRWELWDLLGEMMVVVVLLVVLMARAGRSILKLVRLIAIEI